MLGPERSLAAGGLPEKRNQSVVWRGCSGAKLWISCSRRKRLLAAKRNPYLTALRKLGAGQEGSQGLRWAGAKRIFYLSYEPRWIALALGSCQQYFPKSLKQSEGKRIVGIDYGMLEGAGVPAVPPSRPSAATCQHHHRTDMALVLTKKT